MYSCIKVIYKTNQCIIKVHVQLKISITQNSSLVCYLAILALPLAGTSLPVTIIQQLFSSVEYYKLNKNMIIDDLEEVILK